MADTLSRPWIKVYDAGLGASLEPYPPECLHVQLEQTAIKHADRVACITSGRIPVAGRLGAELTWSQINSASGQLAAALAELGVRKGDAVALILPNCVQFMVAFYAILKAGGVVAAINPTYPPDRMVHQVNDCGARVLICLTPFYSGFKQIQAQTKVERVIATRIREYLPPAAGMLFRLVREKKSGHYLGSLFAGDLWFQDLLRHGKGLAFHPPTMDAARDVAIYQYTGGTTGVAKGAMATHRALVANTHAMQRWLGAAHLADERLLGAIPFFHVYGMVAVLAFAASSGGCIILVPNARDIPDVVDNIAAWRPTVFCGVPALFNAISLNPRVSSREVGLGCFKACFSGSAPLAPSVKLRFEELSCAPLREGFGMSETPTATHGNPMGRPGKDQSIGVPFPDIECRIVSLDDERTELGVGAVGEMIIRGPNMMLGYLNLPDETAIALRDMRDGGPPWLFTGDIARMDAEGFFYIVDRKKDMALIGGFNVYPTTVEKVLASHPAVGEAGVTRMPHPEQDGAEVLLAAIVLRAGQSATPAELVQFQAGHLAPYEIARRFAFLSELPKTAIGKTLRRELLTAAQQNIVTV